MKYKILLLLCATATMGGEPAWLGWPKLKEFDEPKLGLLNDLEQHHEFYEGKTFPSSTYRNRGEVINWAHELTHAINGLIRNSVGNSDTFQAVYCFAGRCLTFHTPHCDLHDVRDRIPKDWKGPSYQLYFEQQMNDWHRQPLYPLDELTAYTNGTAVGLQLKGPAFDVQFSLERAEEFQRYGQVVVRTVKELDPNYTDLKQLELYIDWNGRLLAKFRKEFK